MPEYINNTPKETEKQQLVELLINAHVTMGTHSIADYLISSGVTISKTAQWKTREAYNDYIWVECSNCGFRVENYKAVETGISSTDIVGYKWHACPKCTARMIKE